jgi:hypothetical protein
MRGERAQGSISEVNVGQRLDSYSSRLKQFSPAGELFSSWHYLARQFAGDCVRECLKTDGRFHSCTVKQFPAPPDGLVKARSIAHPTVVVGRVCFCFLEGRSGKAPDPLTCELLFGRSTPPIDAPAARRVDSYGTRANALAPRGYSLDIAGRYVIEIFAIRQGDRVKAALHATDINSGNDHSLLRREEHPRDLHGPRPR